MEYVRAAAAEMPTRLRDGIDVEELRSRVAALAESAQYGWGHTIDFGPFTQPGLLATKYARIAGAFDALDWWPQDLTGLRVADVGAYTGGIAALMAARGAEVVYAVDELPEHGQQAACLADAFGLDAMEIVDASLYDLHERVEPGSLDVIVCAGVLYHLSDMLVGLIRLQQLLKPGGVLLLETNAVEEFERSYANYGRYVGGMWWQPTAACVEDMAGHAGLSDVELRFLQPERLLARAVKRDDAPLPFVRGLVVGPEELGRADRADTVERSLDMAEMAPAVNLRAQSGMLLRSLSVVMDKVLRLPMRVGYRLRHLVRGRRR